MLDYVLGRLKEPSTWAGIGVVVSLFLGSTIDEGFWAQIVAAGMAIAGVLAVILKENPPAPPAA